MLRRIVLAVGALACVAGLVPEARAFQAEEPKVGAHVLALWEPDNVYFVGTVAEKKGTGYLVVFEDGDTATLPASKIRANDIKAGSKVTARWDDGKYYAGTVSKVAGRALSIKYADGDERWVPWSWIAVSP